MSESKVKGKVLIVERNPYGIRFFVKGSSESFYIKEDDDKKGWFVLVIERNREMTDIVEDVFESVGAKNIRDLYLKLIDYPIKYYEMLIGEKIKFDYLINIDEYKFEICKVEEENEEDALTELSECYSVFRNVKEIDYNDYTTFPPVWDSTFRVNYDFDELLQKALEDPEQGIKEIEKYIKW
jgi:hypothetical protein